MANKLNTIEKLNKIEAAINDEESTQEQFNEAYNLFREIIRNDEVNTEEEAYEFGRIWQGSELDVDWEDLGETSGYLRHIVEKLNSDYIATTYKEELGIELD